MVEVFNFFLLDDALRRKFLEKVLFLDKEEACFGEDLTVNF